MGSLVGTCVELVDTMTASFAAAQKGAGETDDRSNNGGECTSSIVPRVCDSPLARRTKRCLGSP